MKKMKKRNKTKQKKGDCKDRTIERKRNDRNDKRNMLK